MEAAEAAGTYPLLGQGDCSSWRRFSAKGRGLATVSAWGNQGAHLQTDSGARLLAPYRWASWGPWPVWGAPRLYHQPPIQWLSEDSAWTSPPPEALLTLLLPLPPCCPRSYVPKVLPSPCARALSCRAGEAEKRTGSQISSPPGKVLTAAWTPQLCH